MGEVQLARAVLRATRVPVPAAFRARLLTAALGDMALLLALLKPSVRRGGSHREPCVDRVLRLVAHDLFVDDLAGDGEGARVLAPRGLLLELRPPDLLVVALIEELLGQLLVSLPFEHLLPDERGHV